MKFFLTTILLLLTFQSLPQDYNYVHYDTKDGLAGSTVYRICEDPKGYLWFATDNGVSMFDGKRFKNFTSEDGLTDNDVIFIASDSKGRVWMMPFNKSICYYYEGKIYNPKNDSTLGNISFSSWVVMAGENKNGDVYFCTTEGIFIYTKSNELKQIADYKKLAKKFSVDAEDFLPTNLNYQRLFKKNFPYDMVLYNKHSIFVQKDSDFVFLKNVKTDASARNNSFRFNENMEMVYPSDKLSKNYTTIIYLDNYEWMYNTLNGSWLLDMAGNYDSTKPFLPGKKVSSTIRDAEGSIWFSTIGEGIYRLTSRSMKTFSNGDEAFSLAKLNDVLYAGYANGSMKAIKNKVLEKEYSFKKELGAALSRRLYVLKSDSFGNLYLGFDLHMARLSKNELVFSALNKPIKSIDIIDKNTIVASTNTFTATYRSKDLQLIDTIWKERATKILYDSGFYYVGTLDGLVIIDSAKNITREGANNPLLHKRIVDMCKMPDGGIWIATNDNGVLLYKNKTVDTVINVRNGLSSNICKSLFVKEHYLWVGTDKGINKIDILTKKVIARYSVSDGLASNVINAIYAEDNIVWVCSPTGVTYFTEKDISGNSICVLDLTSINVSGNKVSAIDSLWLSYKNNNISFDYTAISFKSAGDITYHYKLKGLGNDWNETRLTTLAYPSLPPGDYELQLYAINKFGKQSNTVTVTFSIDTPFWKTLWFWIAATLFIIGLVWYLLSLRYKRLQKRMKEKNEIMNRMTELEQASLRAQMNPHFIFNCLNSIQHFILKDDIIQTNKYITQFGSLIRKTMDNSARAIISIADEIAYLTSYLELEQMRFSSKFQYEINLDPHINSDYTYIPSMLLQPFVENAIRHGIRNKHDGMGLVKITIEQTSEDILVSIEDNGVGREMAAHYKSDQRIEYQSKGINLTQKRIDILNATNSEKVRTSIIDLQDENRKPVGTKVLLSFPLSVIEKNLLL